MKTAEWILTVVGIYAGAGVLFGIAFGLRGAQRIDPGAKGAHPLFRLFILPGAAVLWPLLLGRWIRAARGRTAGEHPS